jgi:two-component system sensor histidine kinase CreC
VRRPIAPRLLETIDQPAILCLLQTLGGKRRPRRNIELCIDDEGPGIPDYARTRVFEKFFSLERPDTGKKSTGLGLNFVSEVAALHGGTVDVNNLPERGLRARLTLPANLL